MPPQRRLRRLLNHQPMSQDRVCGSSISSSPSLHLDDQIYEMIDKAHRGIDIRRRRHCDQALFSPTRSSKARAVSGPIAAPPRTKAMSDHNRGWPCGITPLGNQHWCRWSKQLNTVATGRLLYSTLQRGTVQHRGRVLALKQFGLANPPVFVLDSLYITTGHCTYSNEVVINMTQILGLLSSTVASSSCGEVGPPGSGWTP